MYLQDVVRTMTALRLTIPSVIQGIASASVHEHAIGL